MKFAADISGAPGPALYDTRAEVMPSFFMREMRVVRFNPTAMKQKSGTADAVAELGWDPGHNPWLIAIAVTLATFMEILDTSVANVALPHIAGGLAAGQDESTWVLTSYLMSNAVVLPLSGCLSSIFGRKRFYMASVALFTLGSFLCGVAPSLPWLIAFRVMQGAGGGGLQPSEQAILADTFPPAMRGMAFAVYGMAVVVAPALGPTIGGWITDNYSWRWIFFINLQFQTAVQSASHLLPASAAIAPQQQAAGQISGAIARHSAMLAYLDNFWLLAVCALAILPLVFLMKKPPKGAAVAAH